MARRSDLMVITPHQLDIWSSNMSELYNSLEGEIIRLIAKRLNNGQLNILDWQMQAMRELHLFNSDVSKLLSQVTGVAETQIKAMFEQSGHKIVTETDSYMIQDPLPLPSNLDNIMRSYYNQAWGDINNLVNQTLISTNYGYTGTATQAYTQVYNRVQALFNTGIYTFEQATERAIQELAQQGVKSAFVDKGGHTWSLERYTRTVLKSTLGNTYDTLRKERMAEYGVYTVVVTSHIGARRACSRIQGHVVDLRQSVPDDSEYKSIYDQYWQADYGSAGGHRGVNCNHLHIPFMPGVNTNNQPKYDAEQNKEVRQLVDKQKRLERTVVKLKKNKMVSEALGNADGAKVWGADVRKYQAKLRELVDSSKYLSRDYSNERVYTPLKTLLQDFRYDKF